MRRVLVVDDNPDALSLLGDLLETLGHEVMTVCDGPGALALLERFTPDYAILDLGMPVMDGFELARRIRTVRAGNPIRLIALTAHGEADDLAGSALAGFDAHLIKPVEVQHLLEQLAVPPTR